MSVKSDQLEVGGSVRGLSQKFVDNMDNFVQNLLEKHIKTTAILPIILTIYTKNLNEMSVSLMKLR